MKSIFNDLLFKIINGAFSVSFIKDSAFRKKLNEIPAVPKDFRPVLRFAVCSDIHINGEETDNGADNFASMLDDMNSLSDSSYNGIDALMVAGDMTNRGLDKQYERFISVWNEHKGENTELLICLGNHEFIEYRDYDSTIGYEKYKKHISEDVDTHTVINGYHFIGISYSDDAKTYNGKEKWIEDEISRAEKESPDKPIFVFQHPMPMFTVYGSLIWGDKTIRKILNKHKSVVDFSGHSHYVPTDPRSVYQGNFTAVGTGSLEGLLGNPGYVQSDSESLFRSAACLVVEADGSGNIRIRCYDVIGHRFFEEGERYFPNTSEDGNFAYFFNNVQKYDTKPHFKNDNAAIIKNEDGTASLVFDGADGYYRSEGYGITVKSADGKMIFDKTVLSEYSRADRMKMNVSLGNIESGKYKIRIVPRSPYGKAGKKLKKEIQY